MLPNIDLCYNYIFIAPDMDDLIIRYHDLNNTKYSCTIYDTPNSKKPKNKLLAFLYKLHTSKRINKIVNLPLKNIWRRKDIFSKIRNLTVTPREKSSCFIIYARYFEYLGEEYRNEFLKYLRTKFKNCKIVLYLADLLNTYSFNLGLYRNNFDAVYSFDKNDAKINSLFHYDEQPFSSYPVKKNRALPQSDVVFIGKAKNRINDIIDIFEVLNKSGITCDFHIVEVPKSEQKYNDKIKYHDGHIDYYSVLQHVISSNCILEILQDGGSSHTARISEAIFYEKKILSNCQDLKTKSYYNREYISLFSNIQDIDIDFLRKKIESVNYNYKHNLSPLRLIEQIDKSIFLPENN
jgi:hypothetical protein